MRNCVLAFAAVSLALSAGPVFAASSSTSPMAVCSQQWQAMKKAGTAKGSYKDFSKTCLSKGGAGSTAAAAAPAPATPAPAPSKAMMAKKPTAPAVAATPAAAPTPAAAAAPAPSKAMMAKKPKSGAPTVKAADTDPTGATAQCKDGTYSHSKTHSGSCAGHKGVEKFLT